VLSSTGPEDDLLLLKSSFLDVKVVAVVAPDAFFSDGTCKLGSRPSIAPWASTSKRTLIFLNPSGNLPETPLRAKYACHLRHSTST
jgi:hypothetical protein